MGKRLFAKDTRMLSEFEEALSFTLAIRMPINWPDWLAFHGLRNAFAGIVQWTTFSNEQHSKSFKPMHRRKRSLEREFACVFKIACKRSFATAAEEILAVRPIEATGRAMSANKSQHSSILSPNEHAYFARLFCWRSSPVGGYPARENARHCNWRPILVASANLLVFLVASWLSISGLGILLRSWRRG